MTTPSTVQFENKQDFKNPTPEVEGVKIAASMMPSAYIFQNFSATEVYI